MTVLSISFFALTSCHSAQTETREVKEVDSTKVVDRPVSITAPFQRIPIVPSVIHWDVTKYSDDFKDSMANYTTLYIYNDSMIYSKGTDGS